MACLVEVQSISSYTDVSLWQIQWILALYKTTGKVTTVWDRRRCGRRCHLTSEDVTVSDSLHAIRLLNPIVTSTCMDRSTRAVIAIWMSWGKVSRRYVGFLCHLCQSGELWIGVGTLWRRWVDQIHLIITICSLQLQAYTIGNWMQCIEVCCIYIQGWSVVYTRAAHICRWKLMWSLYLLSGSCMGNLWSTSCVESFFCPGQEVRLENMIPLRLIDTITGIQFSPPSLLMEFCTSALSRGHSIMDHLPNSLRDCWCRQVHFQAQIL